MRSCSFFASSPNLRRHHGLTRAFPYLLATAVTAAGLGCRDEAPLPTGPEPASVSPVPDFAVASNSWITRRDMPSTERTSVATASLTQDGQSVLYVIGGKTSSGASLGKLMAYHVKTNTWTYHPDMPSPRYETNGAGVINDKVSSPAAW
jgi:hypothetical protein